MFDSMIDGIKATVKGFDQKRLLENPLLRWGRWTREDNGESLSRCCRSSYKGIHLSLYDSGTLVVNGSIHRFFNDGQQNDTLFTFADLNKALFELCDFVKVKPEQIILHKMEIGLNLPTSPIPASRIVNSALLFKNKEFQAFYDKDRHLSGKIAVFRDYSVKLYVKNPLLLRYEIAAERIRYYSRLGIGSAVDLLKREKYEGLINLLNKSVDNIIFFDKEAFPVVYEDSSLCGISHAEYWQSIERHSRERKKQQYFAIMDRLGVPNWTREIKNGILFIWPSLVEEVPMNSARFSILGLGKNRGKTVFHIENLRADFRIIFVPAVRCCSGQTTWQKGTACADGSAFGLCALSRGPPWVSERTIYIFGNV